MNYFTVVGEFSASYEIKRSIFTATVKGINSYDEGINFAKAKAKQYANATHNCYAFVLKNGDQKFFDDGEPSGTAGAPILQVLKKSNLTDVVCLVTRYFGGIKLGAGGLVTAYSKATSDALAVSKIVEMKESKHYVVRLPYPHYDALLRIVATADGKVKDVSYGQEVTVSICVPCESCEKFLSAVKETFSGKTVPEEQFTGYESY